MLGWFRSGKGRRIGAWCRGLGLALLLISFFAPLPAAALVGVLVPGIALFLLGALAWLARDAEPWLRRT